MSENGGVHGFGPRRWVLVAGGFHRQGGMDRCNWALARHLVSRGERVHLVCHRADTELTNHQDVTVHLVPRPGRSFLLGGFLLARQGRELARRIVSRFPASRVVVNGGNCNWPNINWVHCLHHAWQQKPKHGPAWFRLKQRASHWLSCHNERSALESARLVIANSNRTRHDLINHLGIEPGRIRTIYPGSDPELGPPTTQSRAAARLWLKKDERKALVSFVGALGYDSNKGFDVLFTAWRRLCALADWNVDLIVAGGGRAVDMWRQKIRAAGLEHRITMLGFTTRIDEVLAASDLLVSPVHYESYGLNVHEAICCGMPAMVSRSAGVAERYPVELEQLLIDDPQDSEALAANLRRWRTAIGSWREKIMPLSQALRSCTLDRMAEQIVSICTEEQVPRQLCI